MCRLHFSSLASLVHRNSTMFVMQWMQCRRGIFIASCTIIAAVISHCIRPDCSRLAITTMSLERSTFQLHYFQTLRSSLLDSQVQKKNIGTDNHSLINIIIIIKWVQIFVWIIWAIAVVVIRMSLLAFQVSNLVTDFSVFNYLMQ